MLGLQQAPADHKAPQSVIHDVPIYCFEEFTSVKEEKEKKKRLKVYMYGYWGEKAN